jgi:hypothetical protein
MIKPLIDHSAVPGMDLKKVSATFSGNLRR